MQIDVHTSTQKHKYSSIQKNIQYYCITCSHKENSRSQDYVPFTLIKTTSSDANSSHQQQDGTENREDVGSPDYPLEEERIMWTTKTIKGKESRVESKCIQSNMEVMWQYLNCSNCSNYNNCSILNFHKIKSCFTGFKTCMQERLTGNESSSFILLMEASLPCTHSPSQSCTDLLLMQTPTNSYCSQVTSRAFNWENNRWLLMWRKHTWKQNVFDFFLQQILFPLTW